MGNLHWSGYLLGTFICGKNGKGMRNSERGKFVYFKNQWIGKQHKGEFIGETIIGDSIWRNGEGSFRGETVKIIHHLEELAKGNLWETDGEFIYNKPLKETIYYNN